MSLLFVNRASAYDRAGGGEDPREEVLEKVLVTQLEVMDAGAAPLFVEANNARYNAEFDRAEKLYEEVRQRVKGKKFSAPTRRLCSLKLLKRDRESALKLCREALEIEKIAENQAALAETLVGVPGAAEPLPKEIDEAHSLVTQAVGKNPKDPFIRMALCAVAIKLNRVDRLEECTDALGRLAPNLVQTHFYTSILKASKGSFSEAITSLERAKELGLDQPTYEKLHARYLEEMPFHERYGKTILWSLVGWAVSLVVLLALGMLLSKLTLAAATKAPKSAEGHAQGGDKLLRTFYRVVLWACCAYYYISLPIVTLLMLGMAGFVVYGSFKFGRVPIKLIAIVVILAAISVWSILKSLFFRPKQEDPGERLDLAQHPRLREVLAEVASRIGTRPVDSVYMTPTTDIAVFERGGLLKQLTGQTERCLVLGAGVLDGFSIGAFKAVLAHEYGHFHNEDTAGGGFALAVRRSVLLTAISLIQGGAAGWYNPAWLFVSSFQKIFLRISQGASRLQEILADRWAAFAYGAPAFQTGLKHVIERSIRFDAHVQLALTEVIDEKRALANLYQYRVKGKTPPEEEIQKAIHEAIHAEPSPYDSHPSPIARFAWVAALPKRDLQSAPEDESGAWELFADRKEIEKQMTRKICENVAMAHGVTIPAPEPKADETNDNEEAGDKKENAAPGIEAAS